MNEDIPTTHRSQPMWKARLSHYYLGLIALILLFFLLSAFLNIWKAANKEFKNRRLAELHDISKIVAHNLARDAESLLQQLDKASSATSLKGDLRDSLPFSLYAVENFTDIGRRQSPDTLYRFARQQLKMTEWLQQFLTAYQLQQASLYLGAPQDRFPNAAPVLLAKVTAKGSFLPKFLTKGTPKAREIYFAREADWPVRNRSSQYADEGVEKRAIYEQNGFQLISASALALTFSGNVQIGKTSFRMIQTSEGLALQAWTPIEISPLEADREPVRETVTAVLIFEKPLRISDLPPRLQSGLVLSLNDRLQPPQATAVEDALELPTGDTVQIGSEAYYFIRMPVVIRDDIPQGFAVVALSPTAEVRRLVWACVVDRWSFLFFGFGLSLVSILFITRSVITELRKNHSHLEALAMNRTNELIGSNTRLEEEIAERKQAETALRASNVTMEQRVRELSVLNHITQILVSTLDLHTMLNGVSLELMDIFDASSIGIALLSNDKKHLVIFDDYALLEGTPSAQGETIPVEHYPAFQQLYKHPKPLIVHNAQHNPLTAPGHRLLRKRGIHNMMIVPLISHGEVLGTIGIDSDRIERTFTEDEATLAETIAGHIAASIKHARLFLEEQQHRRLAESLREVTAVLNRSLDLDTVIDKILEQLRQVIDYDSAGILLRDGNELVVHAGAGLIDSTVGNRISLDTENPGVRVFHNRETLVIEDVQDNHGWIAWPGGDAIHGWLGAPLLLGNEPLGIVTVDSFRKGAYAERDAHILQAFANQAVIAIQNARLFEQERRQREIAESFRGTTTAVNSSLELGGVLAKILEQLQRVIQYDAAAIFLQEGDNLVLSDGRFINRKFIGRPISLSNKTPETQVFLQKNAQIIDNVSQHPYWEVWEDESTIQSWLGVPLFIGPQTLGILTVDSYSPAAYTEEDAALLQGFANQVSISLHNAQLYEDSRRKNKFFETLMMNSPVATILVDFKSRVQSWNPAAERLFGYTQFEAKGQDIDTLIARQDVQQEASEFSQRLLQGIPVRAITRRNRKDGRFVDIELLGVPVRVEDKTVSFLILYHDISDLQQAREEAEAANRAKSVFLANMSHELRTPLTAILGFSELLSQSRSFQPEEQGYLRTIHRNGEHLLLLLNNLLNLARLETGNIILEDRVFNLHRLLDELEALLSSRVDGNQVQLLFRCAPDMPQFVRADEIKLHQVLLNVLTDVLRFTPQGQVALHIGFKNQHPQLLFEIASSAEVSQEEMDEFLPVTRQFVRLVGADINIESISQGFPAQEGQQQGQSLLFSFAVPIKLVPLAELPSGTEGQTRKRTEDPADQHTDKERRELPAEAFHTLPLEVLDQLEYAVITADITRLKTLLDNIRKYNPILADSLSRFVEDFEYVRILQALQMIKGQK